MTGFMERELMKYMKSSMKAMTPMKSKNMQDKKVHNYCKVNTKLKDWARNCNNVSKTTLAKKKRQKVGVRIINKNFSEATE